MWLHVISYKYNMGHNQHNILYDGHFISIWLNRYNRHTQK